MEETPSSHMAIQPFPVFRPETIKSEEMEDIAVLKGRLFRENMNPKLPRRQVLNKCEDCPQMFLSVVMLRKHRVSEHGDKPKNKCDICEAVLSSKQSLQRHMDSHNNVQPYQCKLCSQSFTHEVSMVRHIRYKHTKERPHKCPVCNYTAVEHSKLQVHIRSHTGESPFSCGMCGMCFKASIALKRHMVTHTGEKHYLCVLCFVKFKVAAALKAHMKHIHHAERQRHLTDIKSIKDGGIPPTFKVYMKKVAGADFNVSSMMHLKYFDIREEFASDLSIFRKRAPVLVGSKAGVSDIDEDFDNSRRKTKASLTPGQLGRMVLGENPGVQKMYQIKGCRKPKVRKSQNKVKMRNVPDAGLLQDEAQAESEVFPVVDSGVETRATDQQNAVEMIEEPAVDYTITANDGTVVEMGVGPTGTVEEEIEYEVQYIGNDANNMANTVTEASKIVEDGVNYCNTVISEPLQNAEVGNDNSMKDKGVHNSADNCIALTENPDIRQCRLSDMREGRYGASPHVIKVLEDGTVIDVTTKYQNFLPETKS